MDNLAKATKKANVSELIREFEEAGGTGKYSYRTQLADDFRYAVWSGQSDDAKKWEKNYRERVFPWDGASDTRIRMSDEITNDNNDILQTSLAGAKLAATPVEFNDQDQSSRISSVLNYFRKGKLKASIRREGNLFGQWGQHYGLALMHVVWERKASKYNRQVTMDQVAAMAQQNPQFADLVELVMDPGKEDIVAEMVAAQFDLKLGRARKIVRELREKGATTIPEKFISKNAPDIISLKVGEDVFVPSDTTDLESARVIFRRDLIPEVELEEKALSEGWDRKFIDAAKKTAGMNSEWTGSSNLQGRWSLQYSGENAKDKLIEIIWAYTRQVDEDGIPGIYMTIFSPYVGRTENDPQLVAKHEHLEFLYGCYPFVPYRREYLTRRILDSRGVPEVAFTWQNEVKAQRDMLKDRAALIVNPPLEVPARMGQVYRISPGSNITTLRQGEVGFLDPPRSNPGEALEIINQIEQGCDRYFGRMRDGVDPTTVQVKRQAMVDLWLSSWSEIWSLIWLHIQEFMSPAELARIAGGEVAIPDNPMEVSGQYDLNITYDARLLDNEYQMKKMELMNNFILAQDSEGAIDRGTWTALSTEMLDPNMAEALVQDKRGSSQKMFDKVNNDIALMALGNEVPPVENDPTAQAKMQFAQQIIQSNPKYQKLIGEDDHFAELLKKYEQNLQMSVMQQQNKVVGRTGVKPMGDLQI